VQGALPDGAAREDDDADDDVGAIGVLLCVPRGLGSGEPPDCDAVQV